MLLSGRFKHAFKTALAITMAYAFALWFDWDKPMWAAFAVAFISMPTFEAGLGKGGQRLWGTLIGASMALTLFAVFPQDRWWFMLAQAGWLAFCAFRMSSGRSAYLWFCAGFVCAIITSGGPDPVNAFSLATMRTLETCLGIICFAFVFSLLWPARAGTTEPAAPPAAVEHVDRINQAMRVFLAYCAGFGLVVFVPGFPGSYGFLGMLAPIAMILANTPELPPAKLVLPVAASILFAAPIYLFIMPMLVGFTQLAVVIFLACFIISYTLHKPEMTIARSIGLAFFAVVTGIANEQTYSFLAVANTALMFSIVLLVLYVCTSLDIFRHSSDSKLGAATGETG
jgi:hypothetical protein